MHEAHGVSPGEIAAILAEIGVLQEVTGGDSFSARAFTNAGRALEGSDADLVVLASEGRLTTLRGVGPGIASVIEELVRTGRSPLLEELRAAAPVGLSDLLTIPGLGPKRIHLLHRELGVDGLDSLEEAARAGKVAGVRGFGAKTEARILEGLAFARSSRRRRRYPEALEIAARLLDWLHSLPDVELAEIAGELRRRCEIVHSIELVAASRERARVLEAFQQLQGGTVLEAEGDLAVLQLSDGMLVRLRCVAPEDFIPALIWETGSGEHLEELVQLAGERGYTLDREGLRRADEAIHPRSERGFYEALEIQPIPPELREGEGEVARADAGTLPPLIELTDLQGTFHCHTTYSDGRASVAEMAEAARARGWSYLGIADHSRSAAYARGLSIAQVELQQAEIDAHNESFRTGEGTPFRLLKGIEADILPDGALDYPDEVLRSFDYVVGSVHSAFRMPRAEMTERIVRAVRHPALTILGHPTGRLLLTRAGYDLDIGAVLEAAAEAGVVVEINANPHRLDLDWREVRNAAALGILIAINPDAHSIAALDHVVYGVNMARKAGLEARQILNTWPVEEVIEYLGKRKQAFES